MEVSNQSSEVNNGIVAFGATLKKAREKQKLSLEDASKELFILKRHLQALEEENFEALPQITFARGFATNYAKYLGLDADVMIKSFEACYPDKLKVKSVQDIEAPLRPMGTLNRDRRTNLKFNPLLIFAVIGVIILAVALLRMVSNASNQNQENQDVSTASLDDISSSEQVQGASLDGVGVAIPQNITTDNPSGVQATGSAIHLDNQVSGQTSNQVNGGKPILDIDVKRETNVSISDASGLPLMVGNQPAGHYQLSGKPPFDIKIANVNDVDIKLNQEVVQLQKYAKNNKASFNLSP